MVYVGFVYYVRRCGGYDEEGDDKDDDDDQFMMMVKAEHLYGPIEHLHNPCPRPRVGNHWCIENKRLVTGQLQRFPLEKGLRKLVTTGGWHAASRQDLEPPAQLFPYFRHMPQPVSQVRSKTPKLEI